MAIPPRDVVEFLIKEILHQRPAHSQEELARLLNQKLKTVEPGYTISGRRARQIAASVAKVQVRAKKGKVPKRCPACAAPLKKIYMKTLAGKQLLAGMSCRKCGYKGAQGRWMPARYEFTG